MRAIVGLQAAPEPAGVAAMLAFSGSAWWIAGSVDNLVPPPDVHDWFERARAASQRDLYWLVHGMGHTGCLDTLPNNEPLSGAEQHRVHRRLCTAIVESEVRGEENLLSAALGDSAFGQPWTAESDCQIPPVWALEGGAADAEGIFEATVPPHPAWLDRTIGFAGLANGGGRSARLGRTALVDYP